MCARCDGMSDEEYFARLRDQILTRGWATQYVEGDNGPTSPVFAYTIGLSLLGHPELICFRMCVTHASLFLDRLAKKVTEGERFGEGDDLSAVFPEDVEGSLELWEFPDSSNHLLYANHYFRRPGEPPVPALQLIFPETAAAHMCGEGGGLRNTA